MATAAGRMDDLVRDYLLFRGLTNTLRCIDTELKTEKEKQLRPEKIVDQLQSYILNYELQHLRDYWAYLNSKFFSRLEQKFAGAVKKLEVGLFKYYLVMATQTNKQDKILEFFEKMTPDLQTQSEFREWFTFPFIQSPQDNPVFAMYFTRQWQDTYFLSLNNFLSIILQAMPQPTLLNFEIDYKRMRNLQEENEKLRQQLAVLNQRPDVMDRSKEDSNSIRAKASNSMDMVYDFSGISDENVSLEKQTKQKSRFPINFSSSPLLGKKSTSSTNKKGTTTGNSKPPKSVPVPAQKKSTKAVSAPLSSSQVNASSVKDVPPASLPTQHSPARMKFKQKEEYEKQRKDLLGYADQSKLKSQDSFPPSSVSSANTESKTDIQQESLTFQRSVSEPSATLINKNAEAITESSESSAGSGEFLEENCPFLLLSQEEYSEHHSAISYCRFSNTGQYVASTDSDGVVKVWTYSPQPSTTATVMSKSPFLSLEWASKSDRWLLLGNKSGNIRLFDMKELKTFYEATGDTTYPRVSCICSNMADGKFVCGSTVNRIRSSSFTSDPSSPVGKVGKLNLWDLRTMKLEKQLPLEPGPVAINCCCFNHNGQLLLTGAADGILRIHDMQQHKCITQWNAHEGEVLSVQFSVDETTCYSLGSDGKFNEWDLHRSGNRKWDEMLYQGDYLTSLLLSIRDGAKGKLFTLDSEGQHLLTCERNNGSIYKLIQNGNGPGMGRVMELKGHKSPVTTVDWSPSIDTRMCLTGSTDGKIKVYALLPQ